jgi:hypothetical protein
MNRFLLLEAIRQSNLHPTTKSFIAAVLKNDPSKGEGSESEDQGIESLMEGGKVAFDDATRQALEERKAEKAQRQMLGAVDVIREDERLGADLDKAAEAEAKKAKAAVAAGGRVRVRPKLLEGVAPAQPATQAAPPTTMKELDALVAKMAGGGTPPKGARERLAKLYGIELF